MGKIDGRCWVSLTLDLTGAAAEPRPTPNPRPQQKKIIISLNLFNAPVDETIMAGRLPLSRRPICPC